MVFSKTKTEARMVVSKTKHLKTKTEARSTQISKTKYPNLENEGTQVSKMEHPNLENEARKNRKRSTQNSKTRHPKRETCLSFKNTRQFLVKSSMLTQQKSSTITNRMQFKTIQVELRGVANAIPSPLLLAILELRRALGRASDFN